jgi:hypothetical protein
MLVKPLGFGREGVEEVKHTTYTLPCGLKAATNPTCSSLIIWQGATSFRVGKKYCKFFHIIATLMLFISNILVRHYLYCNLFNFLCKKDCFIVVIRSVSLTLLELVRDILLFVGKLCKRIFGNFIFSFI